MDIIDIRISFFFTSDNHVLPQKPRFNLRHLKKDIQYFHSKYVFVPTDKASNNITIVWQLHYVDVLKKELVNTKSYISTTLSEHDLVAGHLEPSLSLKNVNN